MRAISRRIWLSNIWTGLQPKSANQFRQPTSGIVPRVGVPNALILVRPALRSSGTRGYAGRRSLVFIRYGVPATAGPHRKGDSLKAFARFEELGLSQD